MPATAVSIDELIAPISSGCRLAIPADYGGVPMQATWSLIARGRAGAIGDLHLICVPTAGMQADLLIGTGMVGTIETSAVSLGEAGGAPRFAAAARDQSVRIIDATCPAIMTGLMAAQKGVPFVPMRGLIGTDLLARRPDWRVIDNPVKRGTEPDPIALIPAIDVDVAFFHVPLADVHGNVWIGRRRELASMAYAARITLVTAERISTESLLTNERDAAGVLPALYVSSVALAPSGSLPYGVWGEYASDAAAIAQYARAAATQQGFDAYVDAQLAARGLLAAVTA